MVRTVPCEGCGQPFAFNFGPRPEPPGVDFEYQQDAPCPKCGHVNTVTVGRRHWDEEEERKP